MKEFLDVCAQMGVADVSTRRAAVLASLQANCYDTVLFLACGYHYIFNADDAMFVGIRKIFLVPANNAADECLPLNMGDSCYAAINGMLSSGDAKIVTELGSPYQYKNIVYPAGVSPGLAGNYNLCTKALNLSVTHDDGLLHERVLSNALENVAKARQTPQDISASHRTLLTNVRASLARNGWKDNDLLNAGLGAA